MLVDRGPARDCWAKDDDARITPLGFWLRRLHLDELPQVLNVLRGEMSFVGPRPEQPEIARLLREEIPYYALRHSLAPGITGWAQVNYGYANSIKRSKEKLGYDLYYLKNFSFTLDLLILAKTAKAFLRGGEKPSESVAAAPGIGVQARIPSLLSLWSKGQAHPDQPGSPI